MKRALFAAHWWKGGGWFIRIWRVSLAWIPDEWTRAYRPPSERYGSGWTWQLGGLRLRYHGRLYPVREWRKQ